MKDKDKAVLGLDIGNGTIKFAIISHEGKLIDSLYTKNFGVIDTVKKGLKKLKNNVEITAVGITGAGRKLASAFIGADVIKTEILAHAIGTLHYMPEVKTIFDLGHEDSKILILRDEILIDFGMNQICSGGCGAFLENVAFRLGIDIEDFGDIALKAKEPALISGKCAVFGTTSCVHKLNAGVLKENILLGVAKSLIRNYLALVAKGKELKPPYVFQGGVSRNKAVVKALEEELKYKVNVLENAPIMGAIGIAILAMEANPSKTAFKGFELAKFEYTNTSFTCEKCPNNCEVTNVIKEGKIFASAGSRCERYEIDLSRK
jgi:predicted CoA-substrate-specific enzyme activase